MPPTQIPAQTQIYTQARTRTITSEWLPMSTRSWTWSSRNSTPCAGNAVEEPGEPESLLDVSATDGKAFSCSRFESSAGKRQNAKSILSQSPLISLLLLSWHWLRARVSNNASDAARPSMRLAGQLALGGRKTLMLVEVDGHRYLVGGSADSVTSIVAIPCMTVNANPENSASTNIAGTGECA